MTNQNHDKRESFSAYPLNITHKSSQIVNEFHQCLSINNLPSIPNFPPVLRPVQYPLNLRQATIVILPNYHICCAHPWLHVRLGRISHLMPPH
jgi:hypothetical protein